MITGDSRGVGSLTAKRLAGSGRQILGFARTSVENSPGFQHREADLSSDKGVRYAIGQIEEWAGDDGITIVGNAACLARDSDGVGKTDEMSRTNVDGHRELVRGLTSRLVRVVEIGSLAGVDGTPFAELGKYGQTKVDAVNQVREIVGSDRFRVVHPGLIDTGMMSNVVEEVKKGNGVFPLEWLAVPPVSPDQIARVVARMVLKGKDGPASIGSPSVAALFVSLSRDTQMKLLPLFIGLNARLILQQMTMTPPQHDAHIRKHKELEIYGKNFPYDDLMSAKLFPEFVGIGTELISKLTIPLQLARWIEGMPGLERGVRRI